MQLKDTQWGKKASTSTIVITLSKNEVILEQTDYTDRVERLFITNKSELSTLITLLTAALQEYED